MIVSEETCDINVELGVGVDESSDYDRGLSLVRDLEVLAGEAGQHLNDGVHPAVADFVRKSQELRAVSTLLQDAERAKVQNELFIEIAAKLSTTLALDELLPLIIDSLQEVVPYDAGGIFLVKAGTGEIEGQVLRGYDIEVLHRVRQKVGQGLLGVVIQTGEPLREGDVQTDSRYIPARPETRSEMVVPLLSENRVIGCFNLESDRLDAYSTHDQQLLMTFASHAAIAIERIRFYQDVLQKRRYEEELAFARQIQLSLLPREQPQFPPYDLAGANYPSQAVGGDYYDFIPLTDTDLGIVIGDVSGKGTGAALIMASFRASLRMDCHHKFAIRDILSSVNHFLWESTASDQFVTAFYGVLDRKSGRLTYGNAGHDAPIIFRADGGLEYLGATGIVLGALQEGKYEERVTTLHPGDCLLLYTDGATEARNIRDEEFGLEGLLDAFREYKDLPAQKLLRKLTRIVFRFAAPRKVGDDVTMIAVKSPAV